MSGNRVSSALGLTQHVFQPRHKSLEDRLSGVTCWALTYLKRKVSQVGGTFTKITIWGWQVPQLTEMRKGTQSESWEYRKKWQKKYFWNIQKSGTYLCISIHFTCVKNLVGFYKNLNVKMVQVIKEHIVHILNETYPPWWNLSNELRWQKLSQSLKKNT